MYKAFVEQITKRGEDLGMYALTKDFDSVEQAVEDTRSHLLSGRSKVIIRRYDDSLPRHIISNDSQDTGRPAAVCELRDNKIMVVMA